MPGFIPPHQRQQDGQKLQHIQAGIWWPAADSAKLRAAAHAWREMAAALNEVQAATRSSAMSVQADNSGQAIDAFEAYWQKWAGTGGYLPAASEGCIAMAKALEQYAQAVDDARTKVEELVAEVGTAIVIGVALSVLTVGISDAAAGVVSAGLIASAATVGVDLTATAATIATLIVGTAFGAVEAMAIDVVAIQPEKILIFHDQKSFSWEEMFQWGEMGALGGFFGAGGAMVIRVGADALPESFSAVLDTRLGQLAVGGLLGGGSSVVIDEIQYGQVNPLDVAAGVVGGAAGGGVRARGEAETPAVKDPLSGPVIFKPPRDGATPEEIAQGHEYVRLANQARLEGQLSPTGRVSTSGQLRVDASREAAIERARAAAAGAPYRGHVGHAPDTTWTGKAKPPYWMDLTERMNTSLGGQSAHYPVGYKPTEFIFDDSGVTPAP